jgi:hypothetical protein
MATYTPDQLYGNGVQGETISGSTLFTFTNPSGSSYFTLETVQDRAGSFSGKQKTTSGSWIPSNNNMGPVQSDYFSSVVVQPGISSVMLTPTSPITGSNYQIKGTGAFTMTTFNPSASLFTGGVKGVWFDAGDITTLFQDRAGTIPVTAVGDPVGKWLDKSGNGNHATASSDAARPTYQIDTEGNPNVTFIKSPVKQLVTPSINFTGSAQMTVCVGLHVTDTGSAGVAVELGADVNSINGSFLIGAPGATTDHSLYLRGTSTIIARVNNVVDGDDIITGLFDISQATKELELIPRLNFTELSGAQITWTGSNAGTGNFGNLPLYLGSRSGLGTPYGGKIYQVIVRGAASTATEVYQIETFTDAKLD